VLFICCIDYCFVWGFWLGFDGLYTFEFLIFGFIGMSGVGDSGVFNGILL